MSSTATASTTATFESVAIYVTLSPSGNEVNTYLDGTTRYRINGGQWLDGPVLVDVSATYSLKNPYFLNSTSGVPDFWTLHNSATLSGNTVVLTYSGGESAVRQALTGSFNGVFRCWVRMASITSGGCEVRVTNGTYPGPTVYMSQSITTSNVLGGKDIYVDFALTNVTNPTVEVRVANSGDNVAVEWVLFGPAGIATASLFGVRPHQRIDVEANWIRRQRSNGSIVEQDSISISADVRIEEFPGELPGSDTFYLSPSGNDVTGNGSSTLPWFSIGRASDDAQPGDTVVMANGTYRFTTTGHRRIEDHPGSATAYITVRPADAANPNVVITEAETISASWESYSASGPYASGIYRTTSATPITTLLNIVRDTTTGDVLYTYRDINDSAGAGSTRYGIADHPEPGWFLERDAHGTGQHRLYVKLASGQTPATGQLTAAMGAAGGLSFQGSSYWKLQHLTFRDFGTIAWVGSEGDYRNDSRGAVGIATGSDYCVVEHCTFDNAMLSLALFGTGVTGGNGTLVRRNLFVAQSGWQMMYDSQLNDNTADGWLRTKSQPYERTGIEIGTAGVGNVIRENVFRGPFNGIAGQPNVAGASIDRARDMDIHHNRFEQIGDDAIEFDGSACVNMRAWMNTFYQARDAVSTAPTGTGPVWIVGNQIGEFIGYPYKPGQGDATSADGMAWRLAYHNTSRTSFAPIGVTPANSISGLAYRSNGGYGNLRALNNVLVGTNVWLIDDFAGNGSHHAVDKFEKNAFYTPASSPKIRWESTASAAITSSNEQSVQTTMNAAEPSVDLVDNRLIVNPFPDATGELNEDLVGEAVSIAGISNIAGSRGNVHLSEPLDLGAFGSFSPPAPTTSTAATLPARWLLCRGRRAG